MRTGSPFDAYRLTFRGPSTALSSESKREAARVSAGRLLDRWISALVSRVDSGAGDLGIPVGHDPRRVVLPDPGMHEVEGRPWRRDEDVHLHPEDRRWF